MIIWKFDNEINTTIYFTANSWLRYTSLIKCDWFLRRARSIRLFWANTDVVIFHCRSSIPIFCNTQTAVERQYFTAMKKYITWNSAQTWVTKIVKNHGLVCRQPSAYHAIPGNECYGIDWFIGTIAQWLEYWALLDAVRGLRVVRKSAASMP